MKIKALVAVRSGSTRVINKNLRPFAGSNLLELKLNQLKRIKLLDGIVVNSNDDEMLAIAKNLGCETVKRDEYYASNTVSMSCCITAFGSRSSCLRARLLCCSSQKR